MNTYTILRRERKGTGLQTTIEWTDVEPGGVEQPTLDEAERYYRSTYAHDDRNGTEVLILGPRNALSDTDVRVLRIERLDPPVNLRRLRVK